MLKSILCLNIWNQNPNPGRMATKQPVLPEFFTKVTEIIILFSHCFTNVYNKESREHIRFIFVSLCWIIIRLYLQLGIITCSCEKKTRCEKSFGLNSRWIIPSFIHESQPDRYRHLSWTWSDPVNEVFFCFGKKTKAEMWRPAWQLGYADIEMLISRNPS